MHINETLLHQCGKPDLLPCFPDTLWTWKFQRMKPTIITTTMTNLKKFHQGIPLLSHFQFLQLHCLNTWSMIQPLQPPSIDVVHVTPIRPSLRNVNVFSNSAFSNCFGCVHAPCYSITESVASAWISLWDLNAC
jgi:hypothetical protein